jgi:hypothetical protein
MKYYSLVLVLSLLFGMSRRSVAQERTTGIRTEMDSATGKTTTVTIVEVKKTEDITPRHDMLVINPLKFFVFYNLSYYHAFSEAIAGGIGLQTPTLSEINGFGANAEMRFYPSKHSLRGFYLAPNVSFNSLKTSSFDNSNVTATSYSIGILLGWQWFPGDDFAMGLGIGYDRYFLSGGSNDFLFGSYNGGAPALRFDIGYGW